MGNEDGSDSSIWLICVLTATLIITGICWRIHVSQICPSIKRTNSDLRHKFTEIETKYRSVNEAKAQICELLTSRREQACSQDWIRNEDRCYFISSVETSYDGAERYCSNFDARLLEINSKEEQNDVSNAAGPQYRRYWIGKCGGVEEGSGLLVRDFTGTSVCGPCDSHEWRGHCNGQHRFICEKSAYRYTDIPEKILDLCQQSVGPT
ncbi:C-type lectin domain family 10 member A-like [Hypanus sabinus]|uniref:C-type lectin domain family 10 member A-like n=1 Tax=Hypanus sabinus TaxID=79690 RepID=UPI0028C4234D|nr:C-type lectin domain family 10 member A-like [Hypanus sabinus]